MSRENMFFSQIEATTDMKNKRKRLASKAMEANLVYFGQNEEGKLQFLEARAMLARA